MNNLESIYNKLKAGDCVLYQQSDSKGKLSKPSIAIIVGMDVWDMAMAVYYTDYKSFNCFGNGEVKVHGFGEWSLYWNILGHWNTVPDFKTLLNAYREQQEELIW